MLAVSQNATARIWTIGNSGGRTTLPYAFTKPGIQMLMTIMKGDLATKQKKKSYIIVVHHQKMQVTKLQQLLK